MQKEQAEKKNPIYAIVGYLTIALLLAGALFKIMHWPGAGRMLQVGTAFMIVGFIPLYVVNVFQKSGSKKITMPYVVMVLVGISLIVLYTNVNMGKYLINIYLDEAVANEERVVQAEEGTAKLLEWTKDSINDPFMKNYYKLSDASKGIALAEYVAISRLLHP